jgi:Raf kinase inhibitor-like YbhB/YbcL family protein
MDDPDAPSGTFTHWLVYDLDPKTIEIDEGHVPQEARQGLSDWGQAKYGGPKPPAGEHRYFFRLYALDTRLGLPRGSTRQQVEAAMKGHVLSTAEWMGRYAAAARAGAVRR